MFFSKKRRKRRRRRILRVGTTSTIAFNLATALPHLHLFSMLMSTQG